MNIESAAAFWRWSLLLTAVEAPWARQRREPECSGSGCNSGCWKTEMEVWSYFRLTHFLFCQSGYICKKKFMQLWTKKKEKQCDDQCSARNYIKWRSTSTKNYYESARSSCSFSNKKVTYIFKGIFEDIPQTISTNWKILDTGNRLESVTKCIVLKQGESIENVLNSGARGGKYLPEKRFTYSVASWVMLLKVKGARVLMLLLLRSLCTHKCTVNAHRHAELATSMHVICPNKDAVCGFCSRLRGWYIHQWQLLHACELLGHRCQHIPLQVTAKYRTLSL